MGCELPGQPHPKTAKFLEIVIEGLAVLVLAIDMSELMLIGEKELGALQATRFGSLVESTETL